MGLFIVLGLLCGVQGGLVDHPDYHDVNYDSWVSPTYNAYNSQRQDSYNPPRDDSYPPSRPDTYSPTTDSYPPHDSYPPVRSDTYQSKRVESYQRPPPVTYHEEPRPDSYQSPRPDSYRDSSSDAYQGSSYDRPEEPRPDSYHSNGYEAYPPSNSHSYGTPRIDSYEDASYGEPRYGEPRPTYKGPVYENDISYTKSDHAVLPEYITAGTQDYSPRHADLYTEVNNDYGLEASYRKVLHKDPYVPEVYGKQANNYSFNSYDDSGSYDVDPLYSNNAVDDYGLDNTYGMDNSYNLEDDPYYLPVYKFYGPQIYQPSTYNPAYLKPDEDYEPYDPIKLMTELSGVEVGDKRMARNLMVKNRKHTNLYDEDLNDYDTFMADCFERKFASYDPKKQSNQRTMRSYDAADEPVSTEQALDLGNAQSYRYSQLRTTPHGRHLLMITLLEAFTHKHWEPRCGGLVRMYLPDSLKPVDQPETPEDACVMQDVQVDGKTWTRDDVFNIYHELIASRIKPGEVFSRFDPEHNLALRSFVKFVMSLPNFDCLMSVLLVLRDSCHKQLFTEAVATIILARDDLGFVLPSLFSITPENFIPADYGSDSSEREPYQWRAPGGMGGRGGGRPGGRPAGGRFISYRGADRTFDMAHPEFRMWHMREDPVFNTAHWIWHVLLSGGNSRNLMRRRGEMFFYMHRQMLNRYNCDRLGVGIGVVVPYQQASWGQPTLVGYRPNLFNQYGPRRMNMRMQNRDIQMMQRERNNLMQAVRSGQLGNVRLGYRNGVDEGISALGDAVEPYNSMTGSNYHNQGHVVVAGMSDNGRGIMASTTNAVRDPAFYQWHCNIDLIFSEYKRNLGDYSDNDLTYNGVTVTSITARSGERTNQLRTFVRTEQMQVNNELVNSQRGGSTVSIERVAHEPFTYTIEIESTIRETASVRVFLIPTSYMRADAYDVAIEMDKFLVRLEPGPNSVERHPGVSPVFSSGAMGLGDLQQRLRQGMSERQFNWAACGYPLSMALPIGSTGTGQEFELVAIVSRLLPQDMRNLDAWNRRGAWTWCGLSDGSRYPDSRPMGYPFDRHGSLQNLLRLSNCGTTRVTITHTP